MTHVLSPGWVQHIWRLGTTPPEVITDRQERQTARLFAASMLVIIPLLGLIALLLAVTGNPPLAASYTRSTLVVGAAYLFSRTRLYHLAKYVFTLLLLALIFVSSLEIAATSPDRLLDAQIWYIAIILSCGLFTSPRFTLVAAIISVAMMFALPLVPGLGIRLAQVRSSLIFTGVLSVLVLAYAALRQRDARLIERQSCELAASEDRLRALFQASFEALVIYDRGMILDTNDAFLELFGYTRDEMTGRSLLELAAPYERPRLRRQEFFPGDMPCESAALRKDGTEFAVEVRAKIITYKGKPARALAVRDITERKRAEQQHMQLAGERQRSEVLRRFLGDATHDLRTPLATINTSLYLLRRAIGSDERAAGYLDTLERQSEHLSRVLEDLFTMSRLDDEDARLDWRPVDLLTVIQVIATETRSLAQEKALTFSVECPPVVVRGDETELKRALRHLVDNALHYTPDGGRVSIHGRLDGTRLRLEIADTGVGIHPKDLPHIFERFYRADKSRRTETGGTGLGLALARKIMEAHGGSISAESTLGEGSLFRIDLPVL